MLRVRDAAPAVDQVLALPEGRRAREDLAQRALAVAEDRHPLALHLLLDDLEGGAWPRESRLDLRGRHSSPIVPGGRPGPRGPAGIAGAGADRELGTPTRGIPSSGHPPSTRIRLAVSGRGPRARLPRGEESSHACGP